MKDRSDDPEDLYVTLPQRAKSTRAAASTRETKAGLVNRKGYTNMGQKLKSQVLGMQHTLHITTSIPPVEIGL